MNERGNGFWYSTILIQLCCSSLLGVCSFLDADREMFGCLTLVLIDLGVGIPLALAHLSGEMMLLLKLKKQTDADWSKGLLSFFLSFFFTSIMLSLDLKKNAVFNGII